MLYGVDWQVWFTPCHKGNFNLNGGSYKIFCMTLLCVTKIFWNMLVFKILNEGFMVNEHSKSITKPKPKLYQQFHFIQKSDAIFFSYGTFGTFVAFMRAELCRLLFRVINRPG